MTRNIKPVDIVGLGENAVDLFVVSEHFPFRGSKQPVLETSLQPGGQITTALLTCRRLGLSARYVGKVGDNEDGKLQFKSLLAEGIDLTFCSTVPACPNRKSIILVDRESGDRTILWSRDERLALRAEELTREVVCSGKALFVDGQDAKTSTIAAEWAREAGIPVVADLDTVSPGIEDLLPFLTHLIAAREFPAKITGQKTPHACLKQLSKTYGVPTVGMTLGPEGALLFEGGSFHYSPGFEVPVVDTTGAGDVFHGAFIYGILRGWPCRRRLDFANALAAMNCTALGARGAVRTREEAEALMKSGSRIDNVIYHSSPDSPSRLLSR